MFNPNYNPTIYSASKIWHNVRWCDLRDKHGFNIIARWINVECGTYENPTGAKQLTPTEKTQLWIECEEDVRNADMTVVYGEQRDELRGAVVEFGMALGSGNPVYFIGANPFFGANSHSDAAYMHHPLVQRVHTAKFADGSYDYLSGYKQAVAHYLEHYHTPERIFAKTGFINARIAASKPRLHKTAIAA